MIKLQLIDEIIINHVELKGYIIEDTRKLKAFAIYVKDKPNPLFLFQQNIPNKKIEIVINEELMNELFEKKTQDPLLRKEYFKKFELFVLEAEQKAKELVFKDAILKYVTDIKLLKDIEEKYLND